MSRYLDLLKQIPLGKEEIPDVLIKNLDAAASSLLRNHAGQYDLSAEERQMYADYEPPDREEVEGGGNWGLLDRWPLELGGLVILKGKDTSYWYLGISISSNPYVTLERGSKEEIYERAKELDEYRKTEGEEAFKEEIMRLVDRYIWKREKDSLSGRIIESRRSDIY